MNRSTWAVLVLVLLVCPFSGIMLAQKEKPENAKQPKVEPNDLGKDPVPSQEPPEPALEDYKLPQNALVIICDSLAKAQKLIPRGFYLTPEKFQEYQELEAKIKQMEGQLKPKKLRPHKCKLTGHLQGDFLELEANFLLVTQQPNSVVALGCQGAFLTRADMDGQFPFLQYTPTTDGFLIQVAKPGEHQLTLSLRVPVKTSREETLGGGIERSVTLGLPSAAVTPPLELKLPAKIKELRWNDFVEKEASSQGDMNLWKVPLVGDLDKIKLSWKEPSGPPGKGDSVTAGWDVTVQLLKKHVITTATLTVQDQRGKDANWQLLVPKGAVVEVKGDNSAYGQEVKKSYDATSLVRVTGPPAQQLEIVVSSMQERQKGKRLPAGPFLVLGVERQQGTYEIQAAPEVMQGQRISYHKNVDLRPLDLPENGFKNKGSTVIDQFEAWDLTQGISPAGLQPANLGKVGPHFELELKPLEAQVETWVEHALRLQPAKQGWHLLAVTKIHASPLFGVDFLDVNLPSPNPEWMVPLLPGPIGFSASPLDALTWLALEPAWPIQPQSGYAVAGEDSAAQAQLLPTAGKDNVRRIDLKKQQTAPFTVTLTRTYSVSPQVQQIVLDLPRPVSLSDKGAKIMLEMEDHSLELVAVDQGTATLKKHKHLLIHTWNAAPDAARMAWQPYQLELPVSIVADVALQSRFAVVQQKLEFDFSQLARAKAGPVGLDGLHQVQLAIPAGIRNLKVISSDHQLALNAEEKLATVEVSAKTPLVLQYDVPRPQDLNGKKGASEPRANGAPEVFDLMVPLVWPEQTTRAETKVRFWSDLGLMPALANLPANQVWKDSGIEEVAGKHTLPVLVLQTEQPQPSLTLTLEQTSSTPLAGVIVDRALIQVILKEEGKRYYRARFLIAKLDSETLDIQFPLPLTLLRQSLVIQMEGKHVTPRELPGGTTARITLNPKLYLKPALLEVLFEVENGEPSLLQFGQLLLEGPRLQGDVHLGQVRWQVMPPSSQVPVLLSGKTLSPQHWRWQGWLFTPESQLTAADLEQWISRQPNSTGYYPAGVVFWGTGTGSVRLLLIPRQAWLLLCSGIFLLLGLGISFLPLKRVGAWLLLVLLGTVLLGAAMVLPGLLPPLLYGIQPGVVVLVFILLAQWLLHQRYRRQMLFMPGFTRMRKGSSISRPIPPTGRETSSYEAGPQFGSKVGSSKIGPG